MHRQTTLIPWSRLRLGHLKPVQYFLIKSPLSHWTSHKRVEYITRLIKPWWSQFESVWIVHAWLRALELHKQHGARKQCLKLLVVWLSNLQYAIRKTCFPCWKLLCSHAQQDKQQKKKTCTTRQKRKFHLVCGSWQAVSVICCLWHKYRFLILKFNYPYAENRTTGYPACIKRSFCYKA